MMMRSPFPDVVIPNSSLVPFVLRRAKEFHNKTAIVCGVTGRSYTYGALADAIYRVAAGLHARGIRKGDVVGIVSPNIPEFPIAFYAAALIGAIPSTVNPIATAEEIGAQFHDSEAICIFTLPALLEKCQIAARLAPTIREIIVFGEGEGAVSMSTLMQHGNEPPHVDIDPTNDLVALPYSSGTSGMPKGVMLTHRNLVANLVQAGAQSPLTEADTVVGVLPFFHIYGMVVIMSAALMTGATIVSLPRFELEQFLQVMQDYQVTIAFVVPPIVIALAKHPSVANYNLCALRMVSSGAAPLGEQIAHACAGRLKILVRQGYGLTETSPVTHLHPWDSDVNRYASVGPMIANTECRIVNSDTGLDVPVGERGELWIRGPQLMKGYFKKPEATAACMTTDGWFKTGDIAIVDENGWFFIVDRVKELIKYKGLQVAPAELEAVLLSHPSIADAAVIPVPDDEAGEIPKAYVVLRAPLTATDVMAYVAERVSPYKKVRAVAFIDVIPKSPSGKILRRFLVDKERRAHAS